MALESEIRLNDSPTELISSVAFSPSQSSGIHVLSSSWDGTINLYNVDRNERVLQFEHDGPMMNCVYLGERNAAAGGCIDGRVILYQMEPKKKIIIGNHSGATSCMKFNDFYRLIFSGSWDKTIRVWDPNNPSGKTNILQQPGKVYSMDTKGNYLVVGTSERHITLWDIRNLSSQVAEDQRDSYLKYPTRVVRLITSESFAVGSIEGRVAIDYIKKSEDDSKKPFAFKCHRVKQTDETEHVFPVNDIALHPTFGTFATGGGDGNIFIWDGARRKRLCQLRQHPAPITSLCFNKTGSYLAFGVSQMLRDDIEAVPDKFVEDYICVKPIQDEAKPK